VLGHRDLGDWHVPPEFGRIKNLQIQLYVHERFRQEVMATYVIAPGHFILHHKRNAPCLGCEACRLFIHFLAVAALPSCLAVSVAIDACDAIPEVHVEGCIPSDGTIKLGLIEVRFEDGSLHSRWGVRCADGIVEVEILDLE
jgi:hypothetical protein